MTLSVSGVCLGSMSVMDLGIVKMVPTNQRNVVSLDDFTFTVVFLKFWTT